MYEYSASVCRSSHIIAFQLHLFLRGERVPTRAGAGVSDRKEKLRQWLRSKLCFGFADAALLDAKRMYMSSQRGRAIGQQYLCLLHE